MAARANRPARPIPGRRQLARGVLARRLGDRSSGATPRLGWLTTVSTTGLTTANASATSGSWAHASRPDSGHDDTGDEPEDLRIPGFIDLGSPIGIPNTMGTG